MAAHSIVQLSRVQSARRFDAEYFKPEYLQNQELLKTLSTVRLGSIARVRSGFAWKAEFFLEEGGEPFIRIRDIRPGVVDVDALSMLEANYARSERGGVTASAGEVVVGMDGLDHFYAAFVPASVWVNQRVAIVTPLGTEYSAEYIIAVINSSVGQRQLLQQMTIATTVGHITNNDIRSLRLPVMSKENRDKITVEVREGIEARIRARQLIGGAMQPLNALLEAAEKG